MMQWTTWGYDAMKNLGLCYNEQLRVVLQWTTWSYDAINNLELWALDFERLVKKEIVVHQIQVKPLKG